MLDALGLDPRGMILDLDVEVSAVADIQYRCKGCEGLMAPDDAVILDGVSWHPEHAPETADD